MSLLLGTFQSTDPAHPSNYCTGTIQIQLQQNIYDDLQNYEGTMSLEYTGTFRPLPPIPNPLPKLPVSAKKNAKGGFDITIQPSIWQPWLLFASMLGIQVEVCKITDYKAINIIYKVAGNMFVPGDEGECMMSTF